MTLPTPPQLPPADPRHPMSRWSSTSAGGRTAQPPRGDLLACLVLLRRRPGVRSGLAEPGDCRGGLALRLRLLPPLRRRSAAMRHGLRHTPDPNFQSPHRAIIRGFHGLPPPIPSHSPPGGRPEMRLRCLLTRSPVSLGISVRGGGGGCFVRRFGAVARGRRLCWFYSSSKGGGVGSAEARSAAAAAAAAEGSSGRCSQQEHAKLGERDQQEWLSGERFLTDCKRQESPFLTRRERFRNEFLRRVVPWEKGNLTWQNFPYYVKYHIEDFPDTDNFVPHLDAMFSESSPPLPWDDNHAYTRDAIELYYQAGAGTVLSKSEILKFLLEGTVDSKSLPENLLDEDDGENDAGRSSKIASSDKVQGVNVHG